MRGIDRFLAAILLAGAIGGTAMFARHLGTVPEPQAVRLTAPPPGHLTAPGAVRARLLVPFGTAQTATGPTSTGGPSAPPTAPTPTLPPASAPGSLRPVSPHVHAPAAQRRPPPGRPAPVAPPVDGETTTPRRQAGRILAAVPLTPTDATSTGTSTGDCTVEHPSRGRGRDSAPGQLKKPEPAPVSPATVPLTPTAPADLGAADGADDSGSAHASGDGNGRGHSKRH
jgi:hypothetical protein